METNLAQVIVDRIESNSLPETNWTMFKSHHDLLEIILQSTNGLGFTIEQMVAALQVARLDPVSVPSLVAQAEYTQAFLDAKNEAESAVILANETSLQESCDDYLWNLKSATTAHKALINSLRESRLTAESMNEV